MSEIETVRHQLQEETNKGRRKTLKKRLAELVLRETLEAEERKGSKGSPEVEEMTKSQAKASKKRLAELALRETLEAEEKKGGKRLGSSVTGEGDVSQKRRQEEASVPEETGETTTILLFYAYVRPSWTKVGASCLVLWCELLGPQSPVSLG